METLFKQLQAKGIKVQVTVIDKKAIDKDLATPELVQNIDTFKVLPQFKNIVHQKVLQQNVRNICGFHAFYNSKCMLRHLLQNESLASKLNDRECFWDEYESILSHLLSCKNRNLVSESDKKELIDDIETPLERGHLKYLLSHDQELQQLKAFAQSSDIKIFVEMVYYGFASMQTSNERAAQLTNTFALFKGQKTEAIFVIYLGVTSHWVNIVIHNSKQGDYTIYLLDPVNLNFLECSEEQLPAIYDLRIHQKIDQGTPKDHYTCTFTTKMFLHSLMDIRHFLIFLQNIIYNDEIYHQHINSRLLHGRLKYFWKFTQSLRDDKDQIIVPHCNMTLNENQLKLNNEKGIVKQQYNSLLRFTDLPDQLLSQLGGKPNIFYAEVFKKEWVFNQFTFPYYQIPSSSNFEFMSKESNNEGLYTAFSDLLTHYTLEDLFEIFQEKLDAFRNTNAFNNSDEEILIHFCKCAYMVYQQRQNQRGEIMWQFDALVGLLAEALIKLTSVHHKGKPNNQIPNKFNNKL